MSTRACPRRPTGGRGLTDPSPPDGVRGKVRAWHCPSTRLSNRCSPRPPTACRADDGWLFEPKWDGFRALVFRDGDEVYTQSRDLKPLDRYFPELADPLRAALPERCILDGEVVIARDGALDFEALLLRIHPAASRVKMLAAGIAGRRSSRGTSSRSATRTCAATPQGERRARLEAVLGGAEPPVHLTPATRDRATAAEWFERFEGAGLDGVVAKRLDAPYQPGKRAMLKIKHQRTADCVVAGFRWHKNGPGTHVGSLLLGLFDDDGTLHHVGVTSSFSWDRRAELAEELAPLREGALEGHPWREWAEWAAPATPTRRASGCRARRRAGTAARTCRGSRSAPERVAEVAYDHLQGDRFRHGDDVQALAAGQAAGGVPLRPARGDRAVPAGRASSAATRRRVTLRPRPGRRRLDQRLHLEALERLRPDRARRRRRRSSRDRRRGDRAVGRHELRRRSTGCSSEAGPTSSTWRCRRIGRWPIGERLVAQRIPFLAEKPLAASDGDGPAAAGGRDRQGRPRRRASATTSARSTSWPRSGRDWPSRPPQLVVARWLDSTPPPAWWGRVDEGGGQVIEQATHLYDLARYLVGEATVVGAASTRDPLASPLSVDVADSSAAVLRFAAGAVGSFANTRRLATAVIEVEFVSDGLLTKLSKHPDRGQGDWHASFDDGTVIRAITAEADPYEQTGRGLPRRGRGADPDGVLSSYGDALRTDRLTRAVVAATGQPG